MYTTEQVHEYLIEYWENGHGTKMYIQALNPQQAVEWSGIPEENIVSVFVNVTKLAKSA